MTDFQTEATALLDELPTEVEEPMAYGDYSLKLALQRFSLTPHAPMPLFTNVASVSAPTELLWMLKVNRPSAVLSEQAKASLLVCPVLSTARSLAEPNAALFVGVDLVADPGQGLRGQCDFLLAAVPQFPVVRAPILVVIEAEGDDPEDGYGQCVAQMIGCMKFNETAQKPTPTVYGCVTTGQDWRFMKLSGQTVWIDADLYYLGPDLDKILGILVAILKGTT